MRAHVSNEMEVACYRTERTLMGCADPLRRGSVHPISVLELTKNEVVGGVVTGQLVLEVQAPNPL